MRHLLLAAALAVGLPACTHAAHDTVVMSSSTEAPSEPPAPQAETPKVERPGYFWIAGRWEWSSNQWSWIGGHWEKERDGKRWEPGHWDRAGQTWRWTEGRWADAPGT